MIDGLACGFAGAGGRVGCRNHVLVLPSVVCAARVARDIAEAVGAVTITHQHGCSQVGDDGVRTRVAFVETACNPNVAGALVVSLGCETIQGRSLADTIGARAQRVAFVGIQDTGGSRETVRAGAEAARELLRVAAGVDRPPLAASGLVLGIEISRPSQLAAAFVRRALDEGATVLIGELADCRTSGAVRIDAGRGVQQHVAFAAAGAQLIVAFPDVEQAPVGFTICPVISVAGSSALHRAVSDDFDLDERADADELWELVVEVLGGLQTVAETLGSHVFALERVAMSM